jgi:hypothetical protein
MPIARPVQLILYGLRSGMIGFDTLLTITHDANVELLMHTLERVTDAKTEN